MAASATAPSAPVRPRTACGSAARSATSCARSPAPACSTELAQETALRILITRPQAEAAALARRLEVLEHEVLVEPLLTIEPLPVVPRLDGVQALALTSANAAPALSAACRDLPLFAVAGASAAAARAAGCTRVEQAGGDAVSLARLIATRCQPADGAILHLSGTEVRAGLAERLADAGFAVVRQAVYRAHAARCLSAPTRAALRAGIDAVLLFSPRTARNFGELVALHGLERCLGRTDALCLSAAVAEAWGAEACGAIVWRAVRIAARPDQAALVDLLEAADRRC